MSYWSRPSELAWESLKWVKVFVVALLLLSFLLVAVRVSGSISAQSALAAAQVE